MASNKYNFSRMGVVRQCLIKELFKGQIELASHVYKAVVG